MPEARAFLEDTPTAPTSPHHPIDEPVIDVFMERLRNNKPTTPNSSEKTIAIFL